MLDKVLKRVLVVLAIIFETQAFWWQPTTTETPAASLKHIPLTYFRTYTYQPLTGGPFSFPFGFGGPAQTPILNGGRYEQYTFPTNQHSLLTAQRPPFSVQPTTTTTTPAPTTQPTTTTTTTTPAPTTTTSTTPSTTTTTASAPQQSIEPLINSGGGTFGPVPPYESSIYPNYNRRIYTNSYNDGNYYRPHYPYPDYATKTPSMFNNMPPRPNHVQFVPCMCPVSVGVPSGLPIVGGGTAGMAMTDPVQNLYMPQGRSNDNGIESDVSLSLEDEESKETSINSNTAEDQQFSDDTLLNNDSQQSTVLETNKIDSVYRQPKVDSIEVISS